MLAWPAGRHFRPSLEGYTAWLYPITGITPAALPPDSPWLGYAYGTALFTVNPQLILVRGPFFTQAVYNLAADLQVQWTPDVDPPVFYPTPWPAQGDGDPQQLKFFEYLRKQYDVNGFVPGVVEATADEGTSTSLKVPDNFDTLTIDQLQNLKTPWGRVYLGYAMKAGTLWGLS